MAEDIRTETGATQSVVEQPKLTERQPQQTQPFTPASDEYRTRYEQDSRKWDTERSSWQKEREQLQAKAKRADHWDGWWNNNLASHYSDTQAFHQDLMGWLQDRAQYAETKGERQEAKQAIAAAEDGYITTASVQQMLKERDDYYQQAMQALYQAASQNIPQAVLQQLASTVLPQAFNLYDSTASLRSKYKDDPEFDLTKIVNHMVEKKIADPDQAYQMIYGDRDRQRAIEAAEKKAYDKAKAEFAQEASKKDFRVMTTPGVPKLQSEGTARNLEEAKERTRREIAEKHGPQALYSIQ